MPGHRHIRRIRDHDLDDGARRGMNQLMIAINEREEATGQTETEWLMPDGSTEMAQPSLADLLWGRSQGEQHDKKRIVREFAMR